LFEFIWLCLEYSSNLLCLNLKRNEKQKKTLSSVSSQRSKSSQKRPRPNYAKYFMIIKQSGGRTITKLSQPRWLAVGRAVGRSRVRPPGHAIYYFAIPDSFQAGWWDQVVSFVGQKRKKNITKPPCPQRPKYYSQRPRPN
jgi:hypothetical protein